jgi:hypothetical protein
LIEIRDHASPLRRAGARSAEDIKAVGYTGKADVREDTAHDARVIRDVGNTAALVQRLLRRRRKRVLVPRLVEQRADAAPTGSRVAELFVVRDGFSKIRSVWIGVTPGWVDLVEDTKEETGSPNGRDLR